MPNINEAPTIYPVGTNTDDGRHVTTLIGGVAQWALVAQTSSGLSAQDVAWVQASANRQTFDATQLPAAYDPAATYAVNDEVFYQGKLYTSTAAITTPEAFDGTKWDDQTEQRTGHAGVFADDTERDAYTTTQTDVDQAKTYLKLDNNTIWRSTAVGTGASAGWVEVSPTTAVTLIYTGPFNTTVPYAADQAVESAGRIYAANGAIAASTTLPADNLGTAAGTWRLISGSEANQALVTRGAAATLTYAPANHGTNGVTDYAFPTPETNRILTVVLDGGHSVTLPAPIGQITNNNPSQPQAFHFWHNGTDWEQFSSAEGLFKGRTTAANLAALQIGALTDGNAYIDENKQLYYFDATATSGDIEPAGKATPGTDPGWFILSGDLSTVYPGNAASPTLFKRNIYWLNETIGPFPTAAANQWLNITYIQSDASNFDENALPPTTLEHWTTVEDPVTPGNWHWTLDGEIVTGGNTKFTVYFTERLERFWFDFHDRRNRFKDTRRTRFSISVEELTTGNADFTINTDPTYADIPIQGGFTRLVGRYEYNQPTNANGYDIVLDWRQLAGEYIIEIQDSHNNAAGAPVTFGRVPNRYGAVDNVVAKSLAQDPPKPTWQANTAYDANFVVLGQAPAGVAETQGDWYVGTAGTNRPNTIADLDATEWANWTWVALAPVKVDITVATAPELPPAATVLVGSVARVTNDGINSGTYTAIGAAPGANATTWLPNDVNRIPTHTMVVGQTVFPAGTANESGLVIKHQIGGADRRSLWEPADKNGDGSAFTVSAAFDTTEWQRVGVSQVEAEDLNIVYYADNTAQLEAAGQLNEGLTFVDLAVGFPNNAQPGDAVIVRATGATTINGAANTNIVRFDIWENQGTAAANNWQRMVQGSPFSDLPTFIAAKPGYVTSGDAVIDTDYDTPFVSQQGTLPARLTSANFGAGGIADHILYTLSPGATVDLSLYIRKTTADAVIVNTVSNVGTAALIIFPALNEIQWLTATGTIDYNAITVNGVALPKGGALQQPGNANNRPGNDLGNEILFRLNYTFNGATTQQIRWGPLLPNALAGTKNNGIVEVAFIDHLTPSTAPVRYDVTLNGVVYNASEMLGHRGAHDGGPTRYFPTVPNGHQIDAGSLDLTGSTGTPTVTVAPDNPNALDITTNGGPVIVAFTTSAPAGLYTVTQTTLTPQSGVPDTQVIAHGNIHGQSGGVITVGNVPAGEIITNVEFFEAGTTNAVAGTGFTRLAADVISIDGFAQNVDIQITTAATLAPELRLTRVPLYIPGNIVTNHGVTDATFNLPAGARVSAEINPKGWATSNADYGISVVAYDSANNPIAGNITLEANSALIRDQVYAVYMQTNVNTVRNASPTLYLPEFTVPADGVVRVQVRGHNVFRDGESNGEFLVVENVTIAATDRIQADHVLTVTGATINTSTARRISPTDVTVSEQVGNEIILDLAVNKVLDGAVGTNCEVGRVVDSVITGRAILSVIPTGANPTLAITEKDPEQSLNRRVFRWVATAPGRLDATGIQSHGLPTNIPDITTATEFLQSQNISVSPGAEVEIATDITAYGVNANVTHKIAVVAFDATTDLPLTSTHSGMLEAQLAEEHTHVVYMRESNGLANLRGFYGTSYLQFSAPPSGAIYLRGYSFNGARMNALHDRWVINVEELSTLTIVAADRVQTPVTLTITGATINANSPGRLSGTTQTLHENISNTVLLDLNTGQGLGPITPTDCDVVAQVSFEPGKAVLSVIPTGPFPAITVTETGFAANVTTFHYWEGFFVNQAGAAGAGVPGYTFTKLDDGGTVISTVDNKTFNVAGGYLAEITYTALKGRSSAQFIQVAYIEDGNDTPENQRFYPISDDDNNWSSGGGFTTFINTLDGTPKTFGFRRISSQGNGNHDAVLKVKVVAQASGSVLPELFTRREILNNGASFAPQMFGYDGITQIVQIPIANANKGIDLDAASIAAGHNLVYVGQGPNRNAIVAVKPNGADVDITYTERDAVTYQGLQEVGTHIEATPIILTTSSSSQTVFNTGIDLTAAELVAITFGDATNGRAYTHWIDVTGNKPDHFFWGYSGNTQHVYITITNFNVGTIQMYRGGARNTEVRAIRAYANVANGFFTPIGYTPATQRTVTATGGLNTVNGSASFTVFEGVAMMVQLDLTPGQQIDTPANNLLTATNGAVVKVVNPLSGHVSVTAGAGDTAITFTEKNSITYSGYQQVGAEYIPAGGFLELSGGNLTMNTGIDFTLCKFIELDLSDQFDQDMQTVRATVDKVRLANNNGLLWQFRDNGLVRGRIDDLAAKAAGDLQVREIGLNIRIHAVRGVALANNGTVVPTATVAATPVTLSCQIGTTAKLIDGSASAQILEALPAQEYQLELGVGEAISGTPTIDVAGAIVTVTNRSQGLVKVQVPSGGGNALITYAVEAASNQYRTLIATGDNVNSGAVLTLLAGRTMADVAAEFPGGYIYVVASEGDATDRLVQPSLMPIDFWQEHLYAEIDLWGLASEFIRLLRPSPTDGTATGWTVNSSSFANSDIRVYGLSAETALPGNYFRPASRTISANNTTNAGDTAINGLVSINSLEGVPGQALLRMTPGHILQSVSGANAVIENRKTGLVAYVAGAADETIDYSTVMDTPVGLQLLAQGNDSNVGGNENITLLNGKTWGDLVSEYDILFLSAYDSGLRNGAFTATVVTEAFLHGESIMLGGESTFTNGNIYTIFVSGTAANSTLLTVNNNSNTHQKFRMHGVRF